MKSRFLRGTYLPTLNLIVSSKSDDQAFLQDYIETKRKNESTNTLVVDEPQWVVDTRKDSPVKFWVAIGNKFLANEVLPLNAPEGLVDEYRAKGYSMLQVPIGYRENFVENTDAALQDIAGISTASSLKYISGMKWNDCIDTTYKNPFTKEVIEVGDSKDDKTEYWDYFDLSVISSELKSRPLYIHLDMSVSGDKTGIAGTWIKQKKPSIEGEPVSKSLYFKTAFAVAVKAPKGAQISFDKNKKFIYWLREQGFNIKGITTDTYQSAPVLQDLKAHNFNCSIQSVDRLTGEGKNKICEPYHYLRSTIYDKRIECFKTTLLTEEIIGLEKLSDGHIDHTTSGIDSKDIADALCGSVFRASQDAEQFAFDYGEDLQTVVEVSSAVSVNQANQRQQINADFEAELMRMFNPKALQQQSQEVEKKPTDTSKSAGNNTNNKEEKPKNQYKDFGLGKAQALPGAQYLNQGIIVW